MSGNRIQDLVDALAGRLTASGLFRDVRSRLDAYELQDLVTENFALPACRVIFAGFQPVPRAQGGFDLECSLVVAVIAGREGRADPTRTSADTAAVDLMIAVCQLIEDEPYLGLSRLTKLTVGAATIGVSEESNKKGVAITLVEIRTTLLQAVRPRQELRERFDTGRPDPFPTLTLSGEPVGAAELVPLRPGEEIGL